MKSIIGCDRRALLAMAARCLLAASAAMALPGLVLAAGEPYPSKPIHLVVPYPAGGVVDVMARIVSERMSQALGQPIVVENARARARTSARIRSCARPRTATRS